MTTLKTIETLNSWLELALTHGWLDTATKIKWYMVAVDSQAMDADDAFYRVFKLLTKGTDTLNNKGE